MAGGLPVVRRATLTVEDNSDTEPPTADVAWNFTGANGTGASDPATVLAVDVTNIVDDTDPSPSVSYEWGTAATASDFQAIAGATSQTFDPIAAGVSPTANIRYRVTVSDSAGRSTQYLPARRAKPDREFDPATGQDVTYGYSENLLD